MRDYDREVFTIFLKSDQDGLEITARTYMGLCRAVLRIVTRQDTAELVNEMESMTSVMVVGAALVKHDALERSDRERISEIIRLFFERAIEEQWKGEIDAVMSLCHLLLKSKKMTREEAYQFAEHFLGPQAVSTESAFRKRLDRWVERRGYRPVASVGRPKKERNSTAEQ